MISQHRNDREEHRDCLPEPGEYHCTPGQKNSFDNQYQQYSEECSLYSFSGDLGATLNTFWKGLCIPCGDTNLFSGCATLLLKERLESHLSHRGRLAAVIKNVAMSA